MVKITFALFFSLSILWIGCQSDNAPKRIINPNGDSELALLMRAMFDEGMTTKEEILAGNPVKFNIAYEKIHSAKPTEAGKNESTEYVLFAKAYEASVERLRNADDVERPQAYQTMVETCMNCHKSVCPGPMVKIKKMYLSEDELKNLSAAQ